MIEKKEIDPTLVNNSPEEAREVGIYLAKMNLDFLGNKETNHPFKITHNILIDEKNSNAETKSYLVISKDKLAEGGSSTVRDVVGHLSIDIATGNLNFTQTTKEVVRITEKQAVQLRRQETGEPAYDPKIAIEEAASDKKDFPHLGIGAAVPVQKLSPKHPNLGFFSKAYVHMTKLGRKDLDYEISDFITQNNPDTEMMIKRVILPILEAYKTQFADRNIAHRDIKLENVRAHLDPDKSEVYFIDPMKAPIGSMDEAKGTAGYLPPELKTCVSNPIPVRQARDIFQLGILLTACVNPNLAPPTYFPEEVLRQAFKPAFDDIRVKGGCPDPKKMGDEVLERIKDSFNIPESEEQGLRNEIMRLLNEKISYANSYLYPELDLESLNLGGKVKADKVIELAFNELEKNSCYDPQEMGCYDLFEHIQYSSTIPQDEEDAARKDVAETFKDMTSNDPDMRPPDIDTIINNVKTIESKLESLHQPTGPGGPGS